MPIPSPLKDGFRRFRADKFEKKQREWRELAKGQTPHALIIGCADSRVDPGAIFDAGPGELFVVRNVANLVPPYEPDGAHHGVSAALEFAVKALKVGHIVVLGHKSCGGVHAAATGGAAGTEFLERWIDPLVPVRAEAIAELGETDDATLSDDMELRSVRHSIGRLMGFPFVADAVKSGALTLHGARFGIADGDLEWLQADGTFRSVSAELDNEQASRTHTP